MRLLRGFWTRVVERVGRRYCPGPAVEDALASGGGRNLTVSWWNPPRPTPEQVRDVTRDAIVSVASSGIDGNVALKVPSLGDPDAVELLASEAARRGVELHFDALAPEDADLVWSSVEVAVRTGARVCVAIPGRWRRSPLDAARAVSLGAAVRVVKGQWADPVRDVDLRDGFLAVVDAARGARRVGVASHDAPLVEQSLKWLQAAGTPCEVELLYGLPLEAPEAVAAGRGVPVRLYVPFGEPRPPYSPKGMLLRPVWWPRLVRDLLAGPGVPEIAGMPAVVGGRGSRVRG